jgi:excisionase family DNA binding protein
MTERSVPNLREYLTVAQAATLLGVAANTLRTWEAAGKIPSRRNPANGYRLFKRVDLEAFLLALDGVRPDGEQIGNGR